MITNAPPRKNGAGFLESDRTIESWPAAEWIYQLETNCAVRKMMKYGLDLNRNTIERLEERGLIMQAKSRNPLTIVWRLKKKLWTCAGSTWRLHVLEDA